MDEMLPTNLPGVTPTLAPAPTEPAPAVVPAPPVLPVAPSTQPMPSIPAPVAYTPAPVSTQPVFYTVSSDDDERLSITPWYKRKPILIMLAVIVGLCLVVGLVVVFAYNSIKANSTAKEVVVQKAKTVENMMASGTSQTGAAREVGFVDGCKGLVDKAYANCVSLIAFDQADPTICDVLKDESKQKCFDGATLIQAKAGKSYQACDPIVDEISKMSCQISIRDAAVAAGDCVGYGVDQKYCDEKKVVETPIVDNTTVDEDADGLTLAQELSYGTSDQNPDTDGDGYNDGEEISTGHDPLKK